MTIRQENEISWVRTYDAGNRNARHSITATTDGLEIDYDTIPWEEIDKARDALGKPTTEIKLE